MNSNTKGDILIVDDEPNAIKVLSAILSKDGYDVLKSKNADTAIKIIRKENVDVIITDLKMPGKDGIQFFEYINETHPDIPVIFLTAYGTVESAVTAITHGAFYYFIKPPDYLKLKSILARAVEQRRLKREIEFLKMRLSDGKGQCHVIGNTAGMHKLFSTIEAIKDSSSSVLSYGETGTGKELVARLLHFSSIRKDYPFVAVNCAAIPRELIESELFGYEKGAFTSAISRRIGKFEEASGGTIFLDEIGELDISLQAKLLRVLQEKEIERIGSNNKIKVDFRLVSSTNSDLQKKVQAGSFREDLFYRINVVQLNIPPLRDRKDDIVLLISEFVKEFCIREKKMCTVSNDVMTIFQDYHWPGNVRQLKNVIERAVVLSKSDKITHKELPDEFSSYRGKMKSTGPLKSLKEIQVEAIMEALKESKGNKSKAAKMLGISRKAFYKGLRDYKLL